MKDRFRGGRVAVWALAATLFLALAGSALANNLDRQTAQDAARKVAKRECQRTSGCESFRAINLHKVSRHKAVGKVVVISVKNGERFSCTQQLVIKLDHFTGKILYATSKRRCTDLGPVEPPPAP